MKILFCVPTTALSGGVKVVFELGHGLLDRGHTVDVFSFAGVPGWFEMRARLLDVHDLAAVDLDAYDFVIVSNGLFVPLVLPRLRRARLILVCLDYESFHHAAGSRPAFADFMAPSPVFDDIYRLPIPLVATSTPIAAMLDERVQRHAYYLRLAVDHTVFRAMPRTPATARKRILFVGNYLMPYKGIGDGVEALRRLSADVPVELVIATQERRGRAFFDDLPFPVELHFCPTEPAMPHIMASCDAYCCTSWYEGLGLPALECFRCGVPVVSTRSKGVMDYGVDEENLLLAEPNNPSDLARQLQRVLVDGALADRLRDGGARTAASYQWSRSHRDFAEILSDIDASYHGAGEVDASAMQELLARLESTGAFTPIEVFRHYETLAAELDEIVRALQSTGPSAAALEAVTRLRRDFHRYLANDRAQYFDAFRAKYDFCGLLLTLWQEPRFVHHLSRVLEQSHERAAHTPFTLSEIRY